MYTDGHLTLGRMAGDANLLACPKEYLLHMVTKDNECYDCPIEWAEEQALYERIKYLHSFASEDAHPPPIPIMVKAGGLPGWAMLAYKLLASRN